MAEPIRNGGGNRAGSDAERRAARQLQQRLEAVGRDAHVEPTRIRPGWATAHLVHATAGVIASVLAVYVPIAGLVLALLATASAFGDVMGAFYLVRSLLPVRASQNVVSDQDTGKPGVIVLVAHYDAPRAGILMSRRMRAWPRVLLDALILVVAACIGRVAGLDATWFTVLQFIPTVVLIALAPLFADGAIAPTSDGVHDNSSGVTAVLDIADRPPQLDHFDLMVVFTGASAHSGLGMRSWLKRHRKELDPKSTAVISLDNVGLGTPAAVTKEGPVFASRMHPTLSALGAEDTPTIVSRELSDAYLSRAAGFPTLRLASQGDGGDSDAVARFHDYVADLLERVDAEIGPGLG